MGKIFLQERTMVNIEKRLEKELGIKLVQVQNVIKLLDEGNTVRCV